MSPTARVADSYGYDPHEHKPSQDPFDPETADDKQADTGEQYEGGDPEWHGSSSSTSSSGSESGTVKTSSGSQTAHTAENHSVQGQTGKSSTARSTATKPSGRSGKASS